ncbi:hypothetical protein EXN66_Car000036 [Channa argus]|uniref:Secreted protein n=1 Tax=Channa argus TaxID=215402 RepID=A0A6G1QXR8_CHAAH|nr:hypothetical protein EXN66_Car000036 [Channa argus]
MMSFKFVFLFSILLLQVCVCGSVSCLQSSVDVLPEDSRVLSGLRPAQVGASLHQLPHALVGRQLLGRDVLQKQQDQHVLLLVKQTEAAAAHRTDQDRRGRTKVNHERHLKDCINTLDFHMTDRCLYPSSNDSVFKLSP